MKDVLFEMTRKRLGLTTVVDGDGRLVGIISDGDLRRQMERHGYTLLDRTAGECMTRDPVVIGRGELATAALDVMESRKITSLLIVDAARRGGGRAAPPRPLEDRDDMKDEALAARCRGLRLVVADVDGVLTDGTVLLLPDGGEAKAFHIRDGLAVVLAHRAGLRTALLSGRSSEVVVAPRARAGDRDRAPGRLRQGGRASRRSWPAWACGRTRPPTSATTSTTCRPWPRPASPPRPPDAAFEVRAPGLHGDGRPRRPWLLPRVRGGHPARARRVGHPHGQTIGSEPRP